jgi:hypothetical protein
METFDFAKMVNFPLGVSHQLGKLQESNLVASDPCYDVPDCEEWECYCGHCATCDDRCDCMD